MNPEDRKALEVAREALQKTMAAWGGTCAWHADVKAALALIDERLQADDDGTYTTVRTEDLVQIRDSTYRSAVVLRGMIDDLLSKSTQEQRLLADEKEEPVAWCWYSKSLGRLSDCYGMHELPSDEDKERAAEMGGAIAYLYVGDAPLYAHGRKGNG